jgi:hypothetical protein
MAMFQPDINAQTAQTLRDIVGGGTATQYISEQDDMRRRMNPINENLSLADLEKANLANAQSRLTNPLDVQIKGAAAREANSKGDDYFNTVNSGVMSDARSKVATEKSGIALKNTENTAKQRQILGDELVKRAAWMAEAIPPAEYSAALQQFAQAIPGMTERPEFQALIKQPPDKILAFMQKMGDTLRAGDPALRNAAEIHRGTNDATRYTADQHLRGTQATAGAHVKAAELAQETKYAQQKIESDVRDLLVKKAQKGLTPQEEQQLKLMLTHMYNLKQLGAPKPDIPGLAQTNPAGQAVDRINGGGGTGGPKTWDAATGTWK